MTVTPESNIVASQVPPHERRGVLFGTPRLSSLRILKGRRIVANVCSRGAWVNHKWYPTVICPFCVYRPNRLTYADTWVPTMYGENKLCTRSDSQFS